MSTIQEQWESYHNEVIPKDAHEIQRIETKRAFYAGCQATLGIMYGISDKAISEDAGALMLETLYQECRIFLEGIKKGVN